MSPNPSNPTPRPHVELDLDPHIDADPTDDADVDEDLPELLELPIEDPEPDTIDQRRDVVFEDDER